jgi:predicted dehydrogenase
MSRITRRQFLAGSAALTAAAFLPTSRVLGANNDIRVAVVGVGGRGGNHINEVGKIPGVRITALCDCDSRGLGNAAASLAKKNVKVQTYTDIRKLLDDKSIDGIFIATPNHWHSLCAVWACQAGKDVYVEKPVSHEIWEGRKVVEAARKYNRIVQAGTQSRSDRGLVELFDYIHKGNIGAVQWVRGFCYKRRASIGKVTEPTPIPDYIDYDLWCGPAPKVPLMRKNLHYDWHWVYVTGNGDIGNQAVHEIDMCRWALGYKTLPPRVVSIGGRLGYDDDSDTANTQLTIFDYKPVPIIFEVRGLARRSNEEIMDNFRGVRIGFVVQCENGYYAGGSSGGWVYDAKGERLKQFNQNGSGEHQANFIAAMRSRKISDLHADIAEGHISSALCHMGNISYRVGQQIPKQDAADVLKANPLAAESLEKMKEHLVANDVDLRKTSLTVGPWLEMDAAAEKFTGPFAAEANKLVRREYRKPFEIRDQV